MVDVDPDSSGYGRLVGRLDMPNAGDELHHFGWNACSAALCPTAPHPHVERRYLLVPGLRSSRIHIVDTKPDPRQPKIVKVIEPDELARKTGYSRPHTSHCGPDAIYFSALGAPNGDGPGGVFMLDHENFEPNRPVGGGARPAAARLRLLVAPRPRHHDFERVGTPNMVEAGLNPELLMQSRYGHQLHIWDLRRRRHLQTLDLGAEQQIFYPDGIRGWLAKIDADPAGGMRLDPRLFLEFEGERPHQVRLEGGDSSSDSFCFP